MNPEEMGGFFEGDIILSPGQLRKSGVYGDRYRWPNRIVYYTFGGIYGEKIS